MWHLTFARRHEPLAFVILMLAGTMVYGDPPGARQERGPVRDGKW